MQLLKNQKGFSLLEVLLVIALLMIILGIATINLFSATNKTYQNTTAAILYTDLKSQQVKAMNGDTEGTGTTGAYGVYFKPTQYILFRGTTYSASNPTNFAVKIPDDVNFTNISFPGNQIVFASGSGAFANFTTNNATSAAITNVAGLGQKTVTINRFGVVTSN
jgi:prepilin-type N-terminal cleavage/methylation domain-containing protein